MNTTELNRRIIKNILCAAELNILLQTDQNVTLIAHSKQYEPPGKVQEMMGIITKTLYLTMDDYFEGRNRKYVDLRCITILFIEKYYPELTLKEIAGFINDMDHTSVIHNKQRAKDYLASGETLFTDKFNNVSKAIQQWIEDSSI